MTQPSLPKPVREALRQGNAVEAIKLMRAETGLDLREVKEALDTYLRGDPTDFTPLPYAGGPLPDTVTEALLQGNRIEAVRRMRAATGLGLKEAKDAVDNAEKSGPATQGLSPGQVGSSGHRLWWAAALAALVLGAAALLLAG